MAMAHVVSETAIKRVSGAHALVGALARRGVRYFFGVPGHGAYPIYDALNDFSQIKPVVGRNEQGSLFTADGYARVTNGVAVATSVPLAGVTNAATSLWESNGHGSRVLFLVEEHPLHEQLLRPIVSYYRHAYRVADVAPTVHELFDALETGRPGVAVLEVPNGVLHAVDLADSADGYRPARGDDAARLDLGQLDEAAALLARAERPAICAGGYAWDQRAAAALRTIAEKLGAPVLTGEKSKGALPDEHPLCLGWSWNIGGHAERLLEQADVVFAIGERAGMATGDRPASVLRRQLIHVDWDGREQGPDQPARLQIAGPIGPVLAGISERISEETAPRATGASPWPRETLDQVRGAFRAYAETRCPWVLPVLASLREALPRDAIVCLDSLIGLWAYRLFPVDGPDGVHFPFATGTLGYGVPAAVGVALARPDRIVCCLGGDGAFLYNSQELATLAYYQRKAIIVIANDNTYGAILFNMTERFGRAIAHELKNPDFAKLGDAYGMRGVKLGSPDELGAAVRQAVAADRSTLIDLPLQVKPPRP
jgi:acetolactate synthase-1/2/3 large subunit